MGCCIGSYIMDAHPERDCGILNPGFGPILEEFGMTSVGPETQSAIDDLLDRGAAWAAAGIGMWAEASKACVDGQPFGTVAELMIQAGTWWFDLAKSIQQAPYMGGAGERVSS
jgi:hypothetical protein